MTPHPIRFGLQTGQQMVAWKEIADLWRKADEWGYDSLWVYDHFYPIFVPDPTGPCWKAGRCCPRSASKPAAPESVRW